ncbi:DUF895 domain membrane protein [Entophlyctis sp. JEL0112]|nr:DUF895 domain membrane protein [Entophlyctis sp. JEL0112]
MSSATQQTAATATGKLQHGHGHGGTDVAGARALQPEPADTAVAAEASAATPGPKPAPARAPLLALNRIGDVIVLGLAFLFIFTAFSVCQTMASTVLPTSVAFPELGMLYFAFALINLFGASPLVDRIGSRPSMFVASLTYSVFGFSNVIAIGLTGDVDKQLAVLLFAACFVGVGAALLWTGQGLYVIKCSSRQTIGRYTGVFLGLTSASNFLGPIITAVMLQENLNRVTAFKILASIGVLGPLTLVYIWIRPEPSNPDSASAQSSDGPATMSKTPLIFKTLRVVVSKKMLLISSLLYLVSLEQSFNSGSLPLFIKTDDSDGDLRLKLYLSTGYGLSSMVMSFIIGPVTDFVSNPALIITIDGMFHMGVLLTLWFHPNVLNNLSVLIPANIILAASDSVLMNQVYKILAGIFKADSVAYSAFKFHTSLLTGVAFFISKVMLSESGLPRMEIWAPILAILFVGAVFGTRAATRDVLWKLAGRRKEPAGNQTGLQAEVVGGLVGTDNSEVVAD